jgi:putative nucleotidyltransferase with HDIG domain
VVLLDVVRIDLFEGLNLSAASVPTLALACTLGPVGPIAAEVAIAMTRMARGEARLKWSFDLGALGLAGTAAAVVFAVMPTETPLQHIFAGIPAALAYYLVNTGLMAVVVALAEGRRPLAVWREGMAWLWAHFVVYGVIGSALAVTYEQLGPITVFLFALPVATLWLGQRGYVHRSRASVVELRRHRDDLETANRRLRRLLDEKRDLVGRMHGSYLSTITSLARTIEAKDPYTAGHVERVAKVTLLLADELGLPETQRRAAEVGATIHDIGKIGVPDSILLKPARLSREEVEIMRGHPETSSYIVGELDVPRVVKEMVRSHHERYDGAGYPDGLAGEDIPLAARILAVADTLDAITSDRPYRPARTLAEAIEEIRSLRSIQFCPAVVSALDACLERDPSLGGLFEARPPRFAPTRLAVTA